MNYFKFIFLTLILFALSTKANDVQIIDLHINKSLDQLVLETENNENDEDNENDSINIENNTRVVEESNIIEDDPNLNNIDNQNDNTKNKDEQIVNIDNETFFDLDSSLISIHFDALKNIKSKILHRKLVNLLLKINLEY